MSEAKKPHPRGCPCEKCEAKRQYSREYYHRKKDPNFVPKQSNRFEPRDSKLPPRGPNKPTDPTGRLFDYDIAETKVVHWMPRRRVPGEIAPTEWTCPHCGVQFRYSQGAWERVA